MKKRIALAAIAALAGGLLVAAPASAESKSISPDLGNIYQVGVLACFTTSSTPTSVTTSPVLTVTGSGSNYCVTPTAAVAYTVTASWGSGVGNNPTFVFNAAPTGGPSTSGASIDFATSWVPGPANTISGVITSSSDTASYVTVSGAGSSIVSADAGTVAVGGGSMILGAGLGANVKIATPSAGTITISLYQETAVSGQFGSTAVLTKTITVAVPTPVTYNHTTVSALTAEPGSDSYVSGGVLYAPKGTLGENHLVGAFDITQYTTVADTTTGVATDAQAKGVTVTLNGVGLLNGPSGVAGVGPFFAYTKAESEIGVWNDGRSGTSTITVAVNGVTVATKTITFYGAVAHYSASLSANQVEAGDTDALILTIKQTDKDGNAVPLSFSDAEDFVTHETVTVEPQAGSTVGVETYTVNSAVKVAAKIQVANGVDTQSVTANFVTPGVETITITADKATYAPGEQATYTISAVNKDGVTAGDKDRLVTMTLSANVMGLASGTLSFVDGKVTAKGYMPLAQGPVKVTAKVGNGESSVSVTVVDAAAVANAALIADLKTQVLTLTTTVGSLSASLIPQIKVINATMLKIQKAIAALRLQIKKLK